MSNNVYYFNITYRCNNSCSFCAADLVANDTEHEMQIDDLIAFLDAHSVDKSDRIIVNGGEPTVHHHFIEFIKAINKTGAFIDLFTNGKKLSDPLFVKELLQYSPMLIRIPLFAANPLKHDELTGFAGNFSKCIDAINNILRLRNNENVQLEIKMLLSKATITENEAIFELITNKFPHDNFLFSLNPLLVSHCVSERQELFIESYSSLMEYSIPLIKRATESRWGLKLDLIPFCSYPSELYYLLPKVPKTRKVEYYSDPEHSFKLEKQDEDPACVKCIYANICNHYPDSYLSFMGRKEIRPFI